MRKNLFNITTLSEDGKEEVIEVSAYSMEQAVDFAPVSTDRRVVDVERAVSKGFYRKTV